MSELRVAVNDGIAVLTMDRPAANNSLNGGLLRELLTVARELDADDGVRVVVTTANREGGATAWSAGGDLGSFGNQIGPGASREDMFFDGVLEGDYSFLGLAPHERRFDLLGVGLWALAWRRIGKPLIAAINGAVAGGGLGLAALHDYRIAGETVQFKAAFTSLGIGPDMGLSWLLPRVANHAAATELLLRDRPMTAAQAQAVGLVHQVVPDGDVLERAKSVAAGLAAMPPLGVRAAVQALRSAVDETFVGQLGLEAHLQRITFATHDARAALHSFRTRTPATYQGR